MVSSSMDSPGLSWFCVNCAITILALFVGTLTFFTALLTLDEQRRSARHMDCIPCCHRQGADHGTAELHAKASSPHKPPYSTELTLGDHRDKGVRRHDAGLRDNSKKANSSKTQRAARAYGTFLTHPAIASIVCAGFLAMGGCSIGLGFPNLGADARITRYLRPDSYVVEYYDKSADLFGMMFDPAHFIVSANLSNVTDRLRMQTIVDEIEPLPQVQRGSCGAYSDAGNSYARISCLVENPSSSHARAVVWKSVLPAAQSAATRVALDMRAYSFTFLQAERDEWTETEVWKNMILAYGIVFGMVRHLCQSTAQTSRLLRPRC